VVVKKRYDCGTFVCHSTYAAILFSEYYYDKRYKQQSYKIIRPKIAARDAVNRIVPPERKDGQTF
jgi:hypothetical protein